MDTPRISKPTLWFFRHVVRRYFRRHFHAVRVSNATAFAGCNAAAVVVYANHSSWWDPMLSILLASAYQPSRNHFAPMDATALQRYGILKRLGIFGVEINTTRGAANFLRTSLTLLKEGCVLWITPQGKFADPRERPLTFKPGLASLVRKVPHGCTVVPLAIEYTFWDERLPEVLLHFGEPLQVGEACDKTVEDRLRVSLEEAMQTLAVKSVQRDPAAFEVLLHGRAGAGGWYQRGQHAIAFLQGKEYQAEHTKSSHREEQK